MFDVASLQALGRLQELMGPAPQPVQMAPPPRLNMPLIPTIGGSQFGGPELTQMDLMQQMYQPQMTMQNRFNSYLDEMPRREQPSGWRRFGAGLYAMGQEDPLKAADAFNNYHYYTNMNDWKQLVNPLQQAADNERLANAQDRQFAQQMSNQMMNERKFELAQQKQNWMESDRERLRKRQEAIFEFNKMKFDNPNLVPREVDGRLYLIDPRSGRQYDTGLAGLSDKERLQTGLTNQMALVNRRGQIQSELQEDRQDFAEDTLFNREALYRTRPPRTTGSPQSESQAAVGRYQRAQQLLRSNQELAPFITFGPNNSVQIAPAEPPGLFGFGGNGLTPELRAEIASIIDGPDAPRLGIPQGTRTPQPARPQSARPQQTTAPRERTVRNRTTGQTKQQISTDGGVTWRDK